MSATWIATIAACLSVAATVAAWRTAVAAYRLQSNIARDQKERLKKEALLRSMQSLVVDFADIHATAKEYYSDKRSERLKELAERFNHTATMVRSLNAGIGARLESWQDSKDSDGNNVSSIVSYELGNIGMVVGSKYDKFLYLKSNELSLLRDSVFDGTDA